MKSSRSSAGKKVVAVLTAFAAVGAAAAPLLLGGARAGAGPPKPPWSLPFLAAERHGGEPWTSASDSVRPTALMYVNDTCIHCKAELRLWDSLTAETEPPELRIVASPSSETREASWVPSSLRANLLKDTDGAVAEALKVRAVPVTYWIDATDTVRLVHVGRSTRRRVAEAVRAVSVRPAGDGDETRWGDETRRGDEAR